MTTIAAVALLRPRPFGPPPSGTGCAPRRQREPAALLAAKARKERRRFYLILAASWSNYGGKRSPVNLDVRLKR